MLKLNNPSITDSISKLDPKSISNASPRHIQSVLEDLIVVCLQGQALADKVLRLNPKSEEIGAKDATTLRAALLTEGHQALWLLCRYAC